jgi:hypothetical protein
VTMPDTGGSDDVKNDEFMSLPKAKEDAGKHPERTDGCISVDMRKVFEDDFDWRRCTTACSLDEVCPVDEEPNDRMCVARDAVCTVKNNAMAGSFVVMTPFLYGMPPWPTTLPDTTAKSNKAGRKAKIGIAHPEWNDTVTTVMVRNLHNCISQRELLDDLEVHGFGSAFDFLYLPIDTETNANRGYAFINFVNPDIAKQFKQQFEDGQLGEKKHSKSGKFIKVSPATLQGLEANYAHYSTARVQRGPQDTRPLFLRTPAAKESNRCGTIANQKRISKRNNRVSRIDMAMAEQIHVDRCVKPDFKFCHQCGGQVMRHDFKFCISCGTAVACDVLQ